MMNVAGAAELERRRGHGELLHLLMTPTEER